MLKRSVSASIVIALLLIVSPALAAPTPVKEPPAVAEVNSARMDIALAITAKPGQAVLAYGKGEISGNRAHVVTVDNLEGNVLEVVTIGDTAYVRENTNTRWQKSTTEDVTAPVSGPGAPSIPQGEAQVYAVGEAMVNGAATTQYQIPLAPESLPGSEDFSFTAGALDLFIGKSDNYLHKFQVTMRGADKEIGDFRIELVTVYSDFNQPIAIGAPPASVVDAASLRSASKRAAVRGASALPGWAQVLVAQSLDKLR